MIHILILFIIGVLLGSFLNAWIWRTREKKSIVRGRSICPLCRASIMWFDNIPVISFLILAGKCRACKKPIALRYPIVELFVGIVFAYTYWKHGMISLELIRDLFIIFFLTFVFVYDLFYKEIWDRASTIPAIILALFTLIYGWMAWQSMLIGALVGAGFFLLQFVISKGKWIGGGDIRLGLFMGVILGWPHILVALMIAYVVGAVISIILMALKKKTLASETPFGTYLAFATVLTMFWGEQIMSWYIGLL
jgi:prepilin signal peptidase PulO-like enzyme (type II secretory pathway)